ncbi:nitrilase-related carbon-nitrogen hydrolase [Cellulosilyticum ruminicola]|uniref:nitrilase-related carbon-nitrogen hydrolase n=1 Tax=Cellulosilyticum ruminicola TaxID=425254 RepID=UPI0006CFF758|nr:nitrilase-related carbon-nitrogen hydrolase [Cellulosilyticum ruminicola]
MKEQLRVCTVQMASKAGDVGTNLQKAKELIKVAKNQGAELVLLPELFDVGYDLDVVKALDYDTNETLEALKAVCRELNIHIIAGVYENGKEGKFNTAYVLDDTGNEIAKYRKNKLFCLSKEKEIFTPGESLCTVDIKGIRFGLMICYDIRFPELGRQYIDAGCEALAIVSAFPFPRLEHWKTLLKARAIENQVYVIAANRVGENAGFYFHGKSCIIDPWGTMLQEANETDEIFAIATITKAQVQKVRQTLPALEDR